jgi:LPS export ABC transporter protein LptC
MISKKLIAALTLTLTLTLILTLNSFAKQEKVAEQESDQQISEFSLAGYGEKGKKTWEIQGKSADIFDEVVKLDNIVGNLYGNESINLVADKGDFNKVDGKVHLEDNVVITTSSGAKMTTDSLDWDRKQQIVNTQDPVNIIRDTMVTNAVGATGEPSLNKFTLHKDVQVDINPKEKDEGSPKNKIVITCDGPLEVDYEKNIATFKNNVKVDTQDNQIYSDIMDVYFATSKDAQPQGSSDNKDAMLMGTKIDKIVARGNVKIVKGENVSYSQEAVYNAIDKKIVLTGQPKLVIYSTEDLGASLGN